MRTTLLNPTVWLLTATAAAGAIGTLRRMTARDSFQWLLRWACAWPVLAALVLMAGGGLASRIALGYLSPGAYAREVVAARTFVECRTLYGADGGGAVAEWLAGSPATATPWKAVPGLPACQATAVADRAHFFTNQAHTPMLLLAGVLLTRLGGGSAVHAALLLLSLAAVAGMAAVLIDFAGIQWRSRLAVLVLAAVVGWQPVLAGVKQGDAVLFAAALIAVAWLMLRRGRSVVAASLVAVAVCLTVPALGGLAGLTRSRARAGALTVLLVIGAGGATEAIAGLGVVSGFHETIGETAITYANAMTNYAVLGRATVSGFGFPALMALLGLAGTCTWSARSTNRSFGAFVIIGMLLAPVLWSEHLALALVPGVTLLTVVLRRGSAAALMMWGMLMLSLSLPDGTSSDLTQLLPLHVTSGVVLPATSAGLIALWGWVTFASMAPLEARETPLAVNT